MKEIKKVSIKIKAGAYNAYRNMQNKAHYALAEYVDNAIQSYLNNKKELKKVDGKDYICRINIDVNNEEDYIEITDNAAGISSQDFVRAFEPANIPLNNKGLHEFGMGLKIASIWFADKYTVTSSAIGEKVERHVLFDLQKVIKDEKEDLIVKNKPLKSDDHYTIIRLVGLSNNVPSHRGISKVKNHLASIYRKFLTKGDVAITFNGDELSYDYPKILNSPFYNAASGKEILWREDVEFKAGKYKLKGFIALLDKMQVSKSGFSLFRRGRVIHGSHDEKYHPKILCGQQGSPLYKRIFGEFELQGFNVSFDKGSFQEMEDLEEFLSELKKDLNKKKKNIFKQGAKYRKQNKKAAEEVIAKTLKKIKSKSFDKEQNEKRDKNIDSIDDNPVEKENKFDEKNKKEDIIINTNWKGLEYIFTIQFITQKGLSLIQLHENGDSKLNWKGTINLAHPFFINFELNEDEEKLEPVLKLLESLIIAEVISINQGSKKAGFIRLNLNKILK